MLNELKEYRRRRQTYVKVLRKIAMYILIVIGCIFATFPGLIIGAVFSQYTPKNTITLKVDDARSAEAKKAYKTLKADGTTKYSALTYNLGFNAYNQDMHFFMDAENSKGQSWAQSERTINKSNSGIARILSASHDMLRDAKTNNFDLSIHAQDLRGSTAYISHFDDDGKWTAPDVKVGEQLADIQNFNSSLNSDATGTFDFIAFQEQDVNSTRSYYINEYENLRSKGYSEDASDFDPDRKITDTLADHYNSTFAYNFSVAWIPYPFNQMHGQVQGGLSVSSKYTMNSNPERVTLPNITSFPLNIFELKRCLIITRYPVAGSDKEFVFINAHFSAYDSSGLVRRQQLKLIQDVFTQEYKKGNYVLLGADWNQILPQTYGYEGSDVSVNGTVTYNPNDLAIAPWGYKRFKWNIADSSIPSKESSYDQYDEYVKGKSYATNDVVWYENENDPTSDRICDLYYDAAQPKRHLYMPLVNNPTEEPIILKDGKYIKSTQWKYFDFKDFRNTSINKATIDELLPAASTENGIAKFYTTHAIPTFRDASINFRSNDDAIGYHNIYTASIDGFLISNNIDVDFTFGIDTQFTYSDHNAVGVSFRLKTLK